MTFWQFCDKHDILSFVVAVGVLIILYDVGVILASRRGK